MKWVVCDMMGCTTAFSVMELPAFTDADWRLVESPVARLLPKETKRSPVVKGVGLGYARAGLLTEVVEVYVFDSSTSWGGPGCFTLVAPAVSPFRNDGYTFV